MASRPITLNGSWSEPLRDEFEQPYMARLGQFLTAERKSGQTIFPDSANWFRALDLTPLEDVRVVILGQDPYHGPGQAHGLCFSVRPGIRPPPSLANIFKEMKSDLGIAPSAHGFLEHWAKQGVLLLNSVLTVRSGAAASHRERGWERFTEAVVRLVNAKSEPVAFLLWGSYAQRKAAFVDQEKHLVLKAPHPSPLSAHRGFFGCAHFSRTNAFLRDRGQAPIDWALPQGVAAE